MASEAISSSATASGTTCTSTSTSEPSLRLRLVMRFDRPVSSASRVMERPSSRRASSSTTRSSMGWPSASSGNQPNNRVAPGFQDVTVSPAPTVVTTATGLASTSDSK